MDRELQKRFQEIYQANQDRVYRLCRAYLGDSGEVDDLFQEVFVRVWQNLGGFRGEAAASTWIYRITVNTALLWRKRQARRSAREILGLGGQLETLPSPPQVRGTDPRIRPLLKAIAKLKPIDRMIVGMMLESLPYQEIAEATGLSLNNVAVRVNRIKKRLKKELSPTN